MAIPPRTFAKAITEHLATVAHAPSIRNMRHYGDWWTAQLGNQPLRSILPRDIEHARAALSPTLTPQTTVHYLAFARRVFNVAILNDDCDRNPVRPARAPRAHRIRYLTLVEERALASALPDQAAWDLVRFALHTGLRQGEQFAMRWNAIDFTAATLRIPKTKTGVPRHIPLNYVAIAILRQTPRRAPAQADDRVWQTPGRCRAHNFYERVFVPAVARAGITDLHWHDLRHTFASRLVMKGVDLRTVADLLGHQNIQMTMRYAHLEAGHRLEAVQKLV